MLQLKAQDKLCTDAKPGDRLTAALQQDIQGSNGTGIPRGSLVTFTVQKAKPDFSIAAQTIQIGGISYPLSAQLDSVAFKRKGHGLLGALAGAAAGAAVTKAAGGDTKTVIAGAAAAGAAGAMVGSQLKNADGCIDKNAAMRLVLREDLTLTR